MIFLSLIRMYSGFKIGTREAALTSAGPEIFKYYTIDSNVLMGIIAVIAACYQKAVLTGKKSMLSPVIYGLKLAGTVGVTIISIFVFLAYERTTSIGFRYTFLGISSVIVYGAYYAINCAVHTSGNTVAAGHDWYGFASHGLKEVFLFLFRLF